MPHLLDLQNKSYEWFLEKGLKDIFKDISPIEDASGNLSLSFEGFKLGEPKYDIRECKECDTTYAAPLRVQIRLVNHETGEIKDQEVFMGDFPLITDTGTFIINGAERVIVSQLVRSPGVYYGREIDPMASAFTIRRSFRTAAPGSNSKPMLTILSMPALTATVRFRLRFSSVPWAGRPIRISSTSFSTTNA